MAAAWPRLGNSARVPTAGKPPLQYFGVSECARHDLGSPFASYSATESDNLRFEIRQAIARSGVVGRFYGVEKQAYEKLVALHMSRTNNSMMTAMGVIISSVM